MKDGEYWKERFKQMEEAQHDTSLKKAQEIQEQFDRSLAAIDGKINAWYQRLANNNGVSMQEARKMLDKGELKEFQWNVDDYIKYAKENEISGAWEKQLENASARVHISRLEALKIETQQELEKLYGNITDSIDKHIANTYANDFYHTAYEVQKGIGVGSRLQKLNPDVVEKIVCKPWAVDGKNFSGRLWENKTKLINNVHNSLSRMCITGEPPDRAIREIAKEMGVSKAQASRVVMTESAAFANKARKDCMIYLGVEEFEVVETLDSHTCGTCGDMDGKHYPMSEFQIGVTAPPFHPNCYDRETEILTNNGWKLFEELNAEDMVYTINAETMIPEWQKPINYITYQYTGNMLHFKNERTDVMVTPNHMMLVQNMDTSVKDKRFKLRRADTIGSKSKNRMTGGCKWAGEIKEKEFLGDKKVDIETYLKFMAYWLSDGSCTKRGNNSYTIKIAQCNNQWMADSLKTLPFSMHIYDESIEIYDNSLGKYLEKFGKCTDKYIPENIKALSPELIKVFLIAYSKADGYVKEGKRWKGYQFDGSISFFTTSNQLAADLGELIMKAGGRPSYRLNHSKGKEIEFRNGKYIINNDCWIVNWNTQIYSWICNMEVEQIRYNDYVYCVEVKKYNTLLTRRNGKVIWCGNCRGCTCPYFDDEFTIGEERAARGADGKTYYVPANITYEQWKKAFVDGDTKGFKKSTKTEIAKEQKDYTYDLINPKYIDTVNDITDNDKFDALTYEFEKNGYNGRPIVAVDMGDGQYKAITGSHRIYSARRAEIDIPTHAIDYADDIEELLEATDDDARYRVAKKLNKANKLDDETVELLKEESMLDVDEEEDYSKLAKSYRDEKKLAEEQAEKELLIAEEEAKKAEEKLKEAREASEEMQEYKQFYAEMKAKYGEEHMYGKMTDSEYDKLERLERIAYTGS